MSSATRRLVVLALSEASPQLIEGYCADGTMPRLAKLRADAAIGRTRYDAPCLITPQMWATILTGRNAGSHGVFDYWQRNESGEFRETRGCDIRGPRVWDLFHGQGVPCGIVNVPVTYPPPRTKGFAISGQDAPGAHASMMHPPGLFEELRRTWGAYHHHAMFPGPYGKSRYRKILLSEILKQNELFSGLIARKDWRFQILFSNGTAFAQHYFWDDIGAPGEIDAVRAAYAYSDEFIGRVADTLGPSDVLMIISECGAGALTAGVRLNNWLEKCGYLFKRDRRNGLSSRLLTAARSMAPRYLPRQLHHIANSSPVKRWVQNQISSAAIDFTRTVAFHRGKGEGNIYVNLEGRDAQGIVSPTDYEELRDRIAESLLGLVDPISGESVVSAVHRPENLFSGDFRAAPDLVVEWKGFKYMPAEAGDEPGAIFGPRVREYMSWPTTGSHRRDGYFFALGEGIVPGSVNHPVNLLDLAPTWLDLLSVRTPNAMEGRSIVPILRS